MSISDPQALVRARSISPEWRALHSLWCCTVIRARVSDVEYARLASLGFAERRTPGRWPQQGKCDYRLTDLGRMRARQLF